MKKKQEVIEWWFWSLYYIGAAKELNELTLKQQADKGLVIPTIYCFKHGLELFLKFLTLIVPEKNINYIHDLIKLRDTSLGIKFTAKQINSLKKLLFEKGVHVNSYQKVKKYMEERFTRIINLYTDFQVGKTQIRDKDNILFRYPENQELVEFVHTIDNRKIEELNKDIKYSLSFVTTFLILHSNILQKLDNSNK